MIAKAHHLTGRAHFRPGRHGGYIKVEFCFFVCWHCPVTNGGHTDHTGGSRAGQFRVGGDEFPIVVRLRPEDRLTTQDLDDIAVRTPTGQVVPVSALVDTERRRSAAAP